MTEESLYVKEARARGRKDFLAGVPYTHCPFLTFEWCAEGKAWQNGWLAQRDEEKKK
jgi:hypothetical protein